MTIRRHVWLRLGAPSRLPRLSRLYCSGMSLAQKVSEIGVELNLHYPTVSRIVANAAHAPATL